MTNQTDNVVDAILHMIDAGDLLPGQTIDEPAILESCGVSRTPFREALIKLEADGLIQRHPRKGAVLFRPNVEEFLSILEVHANLESHAARLAAHRHTPELTIQLENSVDACQKHAKAHVNAEPNVYYRLNLEFHETVARASFNPVLLELVKTNARKLMAYYRLRYRYPGVIAASAHEHHVITGHILEHRADDAAAAMMDHFNYDRGTIMDLIASVG